MIKKRDTKNINIFVDINGDQRNDKLIIKTKRLWDDIKKIFTDTDGEDSPWEYLKARIPGRPPALELKVYVQDEYGSFLNKQSYRYDVSVHNFIQY